MPKKNLGDPIPRDEPYIVPARPKETFDNVWLRSINIFAPETLVSGHNQGSINIECLPYNPNRTNGRKSLEQCVNEVPEVKVAMDAITSAIPALRTWINTPPPPPSGDVPPNF